jgi:LPS-assembly lipoprotein
MRARTVHSASLPRLLLLVLILQTPGGCGFQLRGAAILPEAMAVTYIQGKRPFDSLNEDFMAALEGRGVRVTADRDEATAILRILANSDKKDVLTVDVGGKVQEIQIRQTIRFDVVTPDSRTLVDPQEVSLARDFVFNKDDILAKERESELISEQLQRDIVNLAMLRITAAGQRP